MDFLKLTSIIVVTAVLTFCATFTATKVYYSIQDQSGNTCPDDAIPSAIVSSTVVQYSRKDLDVVAKEKEIFEENKASFASQLAQKSGDIEAIVKGRETQQQQINAFRQFVTVEHKQPLIEAANLRYEAEAVNYQWASNQEDELLSIFTNSTSLGSYMPTHMSCRSSTCQVTIPSQDDASADSAYRAVWQAVVNQTSESNNTITYFRNPEKGEVVMYISPQGNSIFK